MKSKATEFVESRVQGRKAMLVWGVAGKSEVTGSEEEAVLVSLYTERVSTDTSDVA